MPLNSQGISLKVPDPNNTRNLTINDLIGNRNDSNNAATLFARIFDSWEERHSPQLVYPPLADPVLVTTHLDAWTLGDFAEIIPANIINVQFHIHHIHISSPSANGNYEIFLYNGTIEIAQVSFSRTDKKDDVEGLNIFTPHCETNSQVQARIASENAAQQDTIRLKLWYHSHAS